MQKRVFAFTDRGDGSIAIDAGGSGDVSKTNTVWTGGETPVSQLQFGMAPRCTWFQVVLCLWWMKKLARSSSRFDCRSTAKRRSLWMTGLSVADCCR